MYQLAIIGGGPAGYTAAFQALKQNMSVVLFEKQALGGVCLNQGCIPTKTLLYSAKQYHNALNAAKYGVSVEKVEFNWTKIQQRKVKTIRKLQAGIKTKLNDPNCKYVNSEAVVKQWTSESVAIEAEGETYEASKLLICTGSVNFVPPIDGIDSEAVINSTDALNLNQLPQSIAIVGGGVIGMEFATLFLELGVKVSIIEALPRILANMDEDITNYLTDKYKKIGADFYLSTQVERIDGNRVICRNAEQSLEIEAEKILVCVGRRPNLNGLESLNLQLEGRGLKIDSTCRTSLPNVYAAGDVTGKIMLAHVASRQAQVAVNAMSGKKGSMTYSAIPSVVYTNPEIASIGEIKQSEDVVVVKQLPMTYAGRFVAENEAENGICKVVVDGKMIVGAQLIGNYASEIISTMSVAISQGLTVDNFEEVVLPHPTVSEIFKEVIEN